MRERGSEHLAILGGPPAVEAAPPHHRWPAIGRAEEEAVLAVLRAGEVSVHRRAGPVARFEDAFARRHDVPYAMSTCSGTAALHAAYFGLDLRPGDEVIVPAYTHLSTAMPMLQAHLVPVLCDVDPETGNLDPERVSAAVTPRTRALAVTHQYGHPADMAAIGRVARAHDLKIIEDCSHSHGARFQGALVGTFGAAACFSLQSHKAVVAGEGGILISSDPALFERACLLGHFRVPTAASDASGSDRARFAGSGYGLKNRLHPLGAAVAEVQLGRLDDVNQQRARHLARIEAALETSPGLRAVRTSPDVVRGGYFRFLLHYDPVALDGLAVEHFLHAVHAEGATEVRAGALAQPLHLLPIFQTLEDGMVQGGWPRRGPQAGHAPTYAPGDFPCAERFSAFTIQLPAFTFEDDVIVDAYCAALSKVARHAGAVRSAAEGSAA